MPHDRPADPSPRLGPGTAIGHYRIVRKIAAGGMGEVWLALDTRLERNIALKVLPADMAADAARLERFEREAKTVAGLSHPNIVHVYSVEEQDGLRFLTMEFIEGEGLDRVVASRDIPPERILEISRAIAGALAAAHEKNVIHRDIKPANVMISRSGHVKVLDFGLAKLAISNQSVEGAATMAMPLTEVGSVVGTLPYMSPEQLRGRDVDQRSDIFSLGVVIYELATGAHPFKGPSRADVTSAILTRAPPSISQAQPGLPPFLDQIVSRCLEKDPADRYQSVVDLCHDLKTASRSLEQGETTSRSRAFRGVAGPVPDSHPASPSRRSAWIGIGTVGMLVVASLLGWFFLKPDRVDGPKGMTIAVLPFTNDSPGDQGEFFAIGVHEDVMNRLSGLRDLKVISRRSVLRYADFTGDLRDVGRRLGARYIVEGSVRRWENQIRVSAQLVDATTDQTLWSESYDRELDDVFALQSAIAREIATTLNARISRQEADELRSVPTVVMAAYDSYLKGRAILSASWVPYEKLVEAIAHLRDATQTDPSFAEGWGLLSRALSEETAMLRGFTDRESDAEKSAAEAEAALATAQNLAPGSAGAFKAEGYFNDKVKQDKIAALRSFDKALEVRPDDAELLAFQAQVYFSLGQLDPFVANLERAYELDKTTGMITYGLTFGYELSHRYAEMVPFLEHLLELEPSRTHYGVQARYYQFLADGSLESFRAFENSVRNVERTEGCDVRTIQNNEVVVAIVNHDFESYAESWAGTWDKHYKGHGDWSCPAQINDEANHARLLMQFGDVETARAVIARGKASSQRPVNESSFCIFDKAVYEPKLDFLAGDSVLARRNFEEAAPQVLSGVGFPRAAVEKGVLLQTADLVAPDRVYTLYREIVADPTSFVSMEVICANPWTYPNLLRDPRFVAEVRKDGRFVEFLEYCKVIPAG